MVGAQKLLIIVPVAHTSGVFQWEKFENPCCVLPSQHIRALQNLCAPSLAGL